MTRETRHEICHGCTNIIRVKYLIFGVIFFSEHMVFYQKQCFCLILRSYSYTLCCPQVYQLQYIVREYNKTSIFVVLKPLLKILNLPAETTLFSLLNGSIRSVALRHGICYNPGGEKGNCVFKPYVQEVLGKAQQVSPITQNKLDLCRERYIL